MLENEFIARLLLQEQMPLHILKAWRFCLMHCQDYGPAMRKDSYLPGAYLSALEHVEGWLQKSGWIVLLFGTADNTIRRPVFGRNGPSAAAFKKYQEDRGGKVLIFYPLLWAKGENLKGDPA